MRKAMIKRDPAGQLARFAGMLRTRHVRVALGDEVDGGKALACVGFDDRAEVRCALLAALKIRPEDREAFEELFKTWWDGEPPAPATAGPTYTVPESARATKGDRPTERRAPVPVGGEKPGYSPERLLRRKSFEAFTERDLAEMERLLSRLAHRLATRPSRRFVPHAHRGRVDLRRSFRRMVATRGEPFLLARRAHPIEEVRLVLLCDTSGSMDPYTRFLLAFVLSLRQVARRTEVFAFNTSLTRLTPWLSRRKLSVVLDRLAENVPDWSGGTRMGESLEEFTAHYLRSVVDAKTVLLILSDGLDQGDPSALERAMRRVRARARTIIWLNPLAGDVRYRPEARGMKTALPYVDHLLPAHNLEALQRMLPLLTV